ncbi:MAG: alpha/beta hydrolase, partial [Flavobacteriaceae bacterium]|nr:alpha/beta hydrolase [Flavobacteriaceae bacterium]
KIILITLIIYLFSMLFFNLFQEKFIFQNVKLDANYSFSFKQSFEEITLDTKNNSEINALLFKAENPKGVLLYFHGNKGNLVRWGKIASHFIKYDLDVFVMDYRSYGKSKGEFDEESMYKDAQVCYDYLKSRYSENEISIYGRSLGCTFAVRTAALNKPKQLILESPFYNLKDVAKYHYPFLPFKFLLKYKFNTNEYISSIPCKTIIFHGTTDKVVPLSSGKKLYEKSNMSQTSFFAIEGGTHHNLFDFSVYQDEISALFKN